MAVLLRKACDDILIDYAVPEQCHVDLDPTSKNLTLYFQDKELLQYPGIRFSSLKPTLAEIKVAGTLFTDWLHDRQIQLFEYIQSVQNLKKQPLPTLKNENCTIRRKETWNYQLDKCSYVLIGVIITLPSATWRTELTILVDKNMLITKITTEPPVPALKFGGIPVTDRKRAQKLITEHEIYNKQLNHLATLKAALLAA